MMTMTTLSMLTDVDGDDDDDADVDDATMLKGPSQPVCIAAVCCCYYPGDLISFTVQMTRFVRIFRRG